MTPLDTDLGWHLRYGEYFVKTLHFLRTNEFTYYLPGYIWHNSFAGYGIILFIIYKTFGLIGLNFTCSLLMVFIYVFFVLTYPRSNRTSFLLFLLLIIFSWSVLYLGIRAQLVSFFLTTVVFYLIEKSESNINKLWFLPPIFLVWANVHGAFAFGLLIIFVNILDKVLSKEKNIYKLVIIFLCSFFVTLINPYNIGIYNEGFLHLTYPLGKLIAEWVPPNLNYIFLIIIISIFTITSLFITKTKRKFFFTALIMIFATLAITAKRNLPYISLVWCESLLYVFQKKLYKIEENERFTEFTVLIIILGLIYVLSNSLPRNYTTSINSDQYCYNNFVKYPCPAIQFLKDKSIKNKNIFNNYEWGGYLEWVSPDNIYFVDGRMPTWKTPENLSPYTVFLNIMQAQPGYKTTLDKYKTDVLLIGQGSFLDLELLQNHSTWEEIYRDKISVIYIRKQK